MANTTEISLPLQGMSTDLHSLNVDEKSYTFALNAITTDFYTGNEFVLGNEPSTVCSTEFPPFYQVVGFIEVPEQKRTIYILLNPTNGNVQFGETLNCLFKDTTDQEGEIDCQDCEQPVNFEQVPLQKQAEQCFCDYYMIAQANCLGFDVNYPVDIEYKLTDCGINLYFTDNLNERGFVYFDYENGNTNDHLVLNEKMKVEVAGADTGCTCPVGYTYDEVDNICVKRVTTPLPISNTRVACKASNNAYTNFGVAIYNQGYNINGTGTSNVYHVTDPYWGNVSASSTAGVLNRTALWACNANGTPQGGDMQPLNEYIGFIYPLDVDETKTYYVGIAGDNTVRIRIDCVTVMSMNAQQMAVQYPSANDSAPFKYWHVYPITLTKGHHVIELTGLNVGSVAGFGAEIYDNTREELIAASTGAGLNIIFTTADKAGQPLQVSSTFSGNCPSGACLDIVNNVLVCVSETTTAPDCNACPVPTYLPIVDCDKTKMHPDYDKPCIGFIEFVGGGNLKEGVYQIMMAYTDEYGNPITNYFPASATAPLFGEPIKFETNNLTAKALKFTIDNIKSNTYFTHYNLVVAQTLENFTEFIDVGTFETTQRDYTYTGFEQAVQRLTPQEVLFRFPFYEKARGVTKANNQLFFTGVSEYKTLNLQPVANNVNLYWETVAVKEGAYHDPRNTFYFHGYMRDEVYAFGIVFEYANGRETCAFHIPGRPSTTEDLFPVTGPDLVDDVDCSGEVLNKRWQVYNTADVLGGDRQYNDTCEVGKCWEYGNFAYWESTETYPQVPEIWGELCGKPIRHHKFPDSCVTHIHDSLNGSKVFKDSNYIFPIGVRVDHASVLNALNLAIADGVLTSEEANNIVSYRIVRGNRVGNKSIDAKGLLFNMFKYSRDNKDVFFPNYAYNDLTADDFLNNVSLTTQRYTFHSPDTHFVNAALGNLLKIETEEYGKSDGYFTHSDCQARHKFISGFIRILAFGLGLAAAWSATGAKQCRVTTFKNNVIIDGQDGYGDVSRAGYTETTVGTFVPRIHTEGKTIKTTDTERHDTNAVSEYNQTTGVLISSPRQGATEEKTTCTGMPHQILGFNPLFATLFPGANLIVQRAMLGLIEMDKIMETMRELIPYKNYSIQYNSVGKYNNYTCVPEGKKLRKLDKAQYLQAGMVNVDEPSSSPSTLFDSILINNWDRESSVYLKTATTLTNPTKKDNSKSSMSGLGLGMDDLNKVVELDIASYYAAIKRYVPNQYGSIGNISYLETNGCSFNISDEYDECETSVFGGDTFINRFGLKRKMPFFLHTMCGLPDGSDILYKELGNAGTPRYYFNTVEPFGARLTGIGNFGDVLDIIKSENDKEYDISSDKLFYQNGYIHLFNYGIPYFLVESDINVDYRHGQNNKDKDFYPHNKDLKNWLEEEHVPIHTDNTFFYNRTYSKQNTESPICTSNIRNLSDLGCDASLENTLIYSEPAETENKGDNWRRFKANSFTKFPLTLGRLITADGIENDKVLVRLEKGTQIFNAYNTIVATEENIQVGTGGMFAARPQDLAITDLGYAGTQNRDILHTEYGHIWADAERGQVFNLATGGKGLDEISKEGKRNWFKANLPFQIRKDFPAMKLEDIDNNLNGIGLHYAFDKRFNRAIITKLDYKVVSDKVKYDVDQKFFYILDGTTKKKVELYNPRYFCNKSWTMSYSFFQKSWISYHSYTPNFYVEHIENFESAYKRIGTNQQKTFLHNASNKSYQVFYGKLHPFIIEFNPKYSVQNNYVNSIEYFLEVIRYHNEFDTFRVPNKTFNKAIVYNDTQNSGLKFLKVSNPEDLTEIEYPKRVNDGYEILVSNSEDMWRFNDFWDATANYRNNIPSFSYDCNNVIKQLNPLALNYDKPDFDRGGLRGKKTTVRLINDVESNYKFIFNFGKINQRQSIR